MVRAAACASGEHEVLRYIHTMPFPMNERVELALLELNVLMRIHKASLGRIHLKASHAWTRGEPARVVALVEHAVRDARVTDALKHLVAVAFPSCASVAAAQHVFAVPTFLRQWHERNGGRGRARAGGDHAQRRRRRRQRSVLPHGLINTTTTGRRAHRTRGAFGEDR